MRNTENKPKISIIVAAYNVEQYLDRCMESLVGQSCKEIEIIIVNDGSTDQTGDICKIWKKKDPRIKVFTQQNQGLSAARNTGLKIARGAYVGFVDGDDFVTKTMYDDLYHMASYNDVKLVSCKFIDCYGSIPDTVIEGDNRIVSLPEAVFLLMQNTNELTAHMCNKLFQRELFENVNFPVGKSYEDSHIIVDLLLQCEKIGIINKGEYYYWHRPGSIVEDRFTSKDYSLTEAWDANRKKIHKQFPELDEIASYRFYWTCFYLLDKMFVHTDENLTDIRKMVAFLRTHKKEILNNKYFKKTRKTGFILLCLSIRTYGWLVKLNYKR